MFRILILSVALLAGGTACGRKGASADVKVSKSGKLKINISKNKGKKGKGKRKKAGNTTE